MTGVLRLDDLDAGDRDDHAFGFEPSGGRRHRTEDHVPALLRIGGSVRRRRCRGRGWPDVAQRRARIGAPQLATADLRRSDEVGGDLADRAGHVAAAPDMDADYNRCQRETDGRVFDSPERKAGLDKALREKIMMIKDPSIRSHYGQEIKDLRWQLFRPQKAKRDFSPVARASGGGKWAPAPQGPSPSAKSSILVTAAGLGATEHLREAVILMALLGCPQLVEEFENGLAAMRCQDPDHGRIRDLMLRHVHHDPAVLREKIYDAVGEYTLENMLSQRHVAITPCIRSPGNLEKTRMTVAEELGKLEAVRGLDEEIADAVEDLTGTADEGLTWRLGEAARNADRAQRSGQEDTAEYDIAENGAHISRDERSAFDALLGSILKGDAKDKK